MFCKIRGYIFKIDLLTVGVTPLPPPPPFSGRGVDTRQLMLLT